MVTDCDVDLSVTRPDALRIYLELLDVFEDLECVGPMLTIADIPRSYPLFNRVMEKHIAQFWGRQPEWAKVRAGEIAYLRHRIDTTFAVHRAGSTFRRLKEGIRIYHPFEAKHLDWYVGKQDQSGYRATSSPAISHWDKSERILQISGFLGRCAQLHNCGGPDGRPPDGSKIDARQPCLTPKEQLDWVDETGGGMIRNQVKNASNKVQTLVILHQMVR